MLECIERFYDKSMRSKLLLIQLILLYVPTISLFSIGTANGEIPASLCYIFSLSFAPYLLTRLKRLRLPPIYILGMFLLVFIVTAVNIPRYGLSKSILHWVFGLYIIITIMNVGVDFERSDWLRILERGACIFMLLHVVYNFYENRSTLVSYAEGYFSGALGAPTASELSSLTRGGKNLDCTWLALGAFFVRGRKKIVYVTYALLYSFLAGSRVGIIGACMVILWSMLHDELYKFTKKSFKWYAMYFAAILAILTGSGILQANLKRMGIDVLPDGYEIVSFGRDTDGSSETGMAAQAAYASPLASRIAPVCGSAASLTDASPADNSGELSISTHKVLNGREQIWENAPQMIADAPFGIGVGNAMPVMRSKYGTARVEDVVHNVFLQWTIDEGILGGLWFIALAAGFLWIQGRKKFNTPFAGYFLTYLLLSLVQFHGGEVLMQFVLGVYLVNSDAGNIEFPLGTADIKLLPEGLPRRFSLRTR